MSAVAIACIVVGSVVGYCAVAVGVATVTMRNFPGTRHADFYACPAVFWPIGLFIIGSMLAFHKLNAALDAPKRPQLPKAEVRHG